MNSNSFVVNFDLTADEVNALDTTPVSLGTFGASGVTSLVRVPVRAEIWRDAGTAYTVVNAANPPWSSDDTYIGRSTGSLWGGANPTTASIESRFALNRVLYPANELWIRAGDQRSTPGRGEVMFRVPTGMLASAATNGMVVMPEPGQSFVGGPITVFIEAGTTISDGTGGLHGRIYFDEYPLPI